MMCSSEESEATQFLLRLQSSTHLSRRFWAIKALQHASPPLQEVLEQELAVVYECLSPVVAQLIKPSVSRQTFRLSLCNGSDSLLQALAEFKPKDMEIQASEVKPTSTALGGTTWPSAILRSFENACRFLCQHSFFLDMEDFGLNLPMLTHFTGWRLKETDFQFLIRLYHDSINGISESGLLAVLLATSYLERTLGNVYQAYTSGQTKCPSLLRELLESSELVEALGDDAVFLLRVLVGPPIGWNLRNLGWHGFLHPTDVVADVHLAPLLWALFSVPRWVAARGTVPQPMTPREWYTYAECDERFDYGAGITVWERHGGAACGWWRPVIGRSGLVVPGRAGEWEQAFAQFHAGQHHLALVHILPQVEQSLRMVYVAANGLAEGWGYAQSEAYYTTVDLLVGERLPTGLANRLHAELGDPVVAALWDCLLLPDGPRLRDRLSHGMLPPDPAAIPYVIADRVMAIALYLAARYRLDGEHPGPPEVARCVRFLEGYIPCFHPVALFCRALGAAVQELAKFSSSVPLWVQRYVTVEYGADSTRAIGVELAGARAAQSAVEGRLRGLHGQPGAAVDRLLAGPPVCLRGLYALLQASPSVRCYRPRHAGEGDAVSHQPKLALLTKVCQLAAAYLRVAADRCEWLLARHQLAAANKRQAHALHKLMERLHAMQIAVHLLLLVVEEKWFDAAPVELVLRSTALLPRAQSMLERLMHGAQENQWEKSVDELQRWVAQCRNEYCPST